MAGEYLSVEDVATALGIHRKTVERYLREGKLRGVKLGTMYRIKRTDLDDWLGEKAPEPLHQPGRVTGPVAPSRAARRPRPPGVAHAAPRLHSRQAAAHRLHGAASR